MSDLNGVLRPEDYVEPTCVLCGDPYGTERRIDPVPQQRFPAASGEIAVFPRDFLHLRQHGPRPPQVIYVALADPKLDFLFQFLHGFISPLRFAVRAFVQSVRSAS